MAQSSSASVASASAAVGDLVGHLDLAEVAVRPRDGHQQPRPVPGGDPGLGQGLVQRGQGLGEPAGHRAALGQRPVQVDEEIGVGGGGEPALGDPLGLGRVADPVQRLREPAQQAVVLRRASR